MLCGPQDFIYNAVFVNFHGGNTLSGRTQFSRALLLMRFSACTRIAKTNMPLIQRAFHLLNARSIFAIFFAIERSVRMALFLYNKGMLEKVTMQRTQQFSDFSKSKEPS